jgi:hypothetical protein
VNFCEGPPHSHFHIIQQIRRTMSVRAIALLVVISVLAWLGHALEEARGMQAGLSIYANETIKGELGCGYEATCSTGGYTGVCVSISSGCCAGTVRF